MLHERDLLGIYVPTVTPFLPNEELDLDSYQHYLEKLLSHNIQGLVINGTTGESPTLSWEEVTALVQMTKDCLNKLHKRIPVVIGTGTNSTASTVKRTELAGELGADAVLVVTPYYNRPPQDGVLEHFRRAAQVGVPVIAYEIPSRTSIRLSTDTVRRILDLNGVIGLKDSSGGIDLISELAISDTKPILCGDDLHFYSMLEHGASGGILASANIQTDHFLQVYQLANQGEFGQAKKAFDSLVPLIKGLFQESNPSPLKWVLSNQGILSSDTLRLPMRPISKELQRELEGLLQNPAR
ncbi:4-hydroxy-tetrahydrodipicolinate synthase [Paenibacillus sophorae]|uniref:4-hydroxy-tetrahydrodipicolinate synthase n=1 Tax=Paenibacillus sophorae TaxID=1333845 RepID=A0A1H8NAV5_9BACL|nr:4-hydroxy-tetrahydrodipicolinate synthase [Paenibacillus sophorae]QWU14703.1 4-hydroxy-tetrahydrodipicolinate synthase [Paenibacillus sophorae]SEO26750.1 4-hydroxy-tetrahydrodipicolinate synthase [Paenibacillus sophorae]